MTKPYSLDLRERAVARVVAGGTARSVAATLRVGVSSVVKWSRRLRATGSAAPGKMGGHRPRVPIGECRARLPRRIAGGPDMTLRGLAAELAGQGVEVSYRTVWNFVHREKISYKKSVFPAAQNRPGVARHRARWKRYQDKIDPKRLVFIDETWVILRQAQDQHGAAPGLARAWGAPRRARALRPLEDVDISGRAALRRDRSAMRFRRPDQWRAVPRLCRAMSRPGAAARRHRLPRQSGKPQEQSSSRRHSRRRSQAHLPPGLFARSEPDRSSGGLGTPSPSRNISCEKPAGEPSARHATASEPRSTPSRRKNAQTISGTQDMRHDKSNHALGPAISMETRSAS